MLTIYPNSELYEEIQKGNWKEEQEIEKYKELKTLVENLNIPVWALCDTSHTLDTILCFRKNTFEVVNELYRVLCSS